MDQSIKTPQWRGQPGQFYLYRRVPWPRPIKAEFMTPNSTHPAGALPEVSNWKQIVAAYQEPVLWRALWQMVNTLVPYAALWYLMFLTVHISWWLTAPLAVLAGGFLV